MMMKQYIILTANIHPIGGMQNYVAGKAAYLERNGWKVTVFFWGDSKGTCAMTSMNKYLPGGMTELAMPYNTLTGAYVAEQVGKIGLLSAACPVLAYAGVSISKDWVEFKKIGWKGILIAVLVMIGTYLGSALIAQAILTAQGII